MTQELDLLVRGGTAVTPGGVMPLDVGVRAGRIVALGDLRRRSAAQVLSAEHLHVLPGVVDTQVHFREPGGPLKEDLESGTTAAVLGGVTAVFEMPNTNPATTTRELLEDKFRRAAGRARCDYAFYVGATPTNAAELAELERTPGCCGVKIFMGSSTGDLLVDRDEDLRRVLGGSRRRAAVHSEDEALLRERHHLTQVEGVRVHAHPQWRSAEVARRSTERLLRLAREVGRRIHVLHVSTADEIPLLTAARDVATFEITPQHLTLTAPECYDRLGTYAQMNPPLRGAEHQVALWEAVRGGLVDVLGSDHAPHTREEKDRAYPGTPSGMPGVQTLVPIMLDHVNRGALSLERLVDLTSAGPARVFQLARKGRLALGYDADLTLVDLRRKCRIENDWIASRCGWSPFAGVEVTGWPVATVLRGQVVMQDGAVVGPPAGQPMRFLETLVPEPPG